MTDECIQSGLVEKKEKKTNYASISVRFEDERAGEGEIGRGRGREKGKGERGGRRGKGRGREREGRGRKHFKTCHKIILFK